jgi:hypothetical protein
MPLSYSDFKAELKLGIKRGDSYDGRLDGLVRRAVRWIEQNYTFQYMRKRVKLESQVGDEVIPLPTNVAIKGLEYLRFVANDGTVIECIKGELSDPEIQWGNGITGDRTAIWDSGARFPSHFYLDGVTHLVFDKAFTEVMLGEGIMTVYSDFPLGPTATHWLISNAEGLLLRQSMIEFMTAERDDRGFQAMVQKRQEDVQVAIAADYDTRYAGSELGLAF